MIRLFYKRVFILLPRVWISCCSGAQGLCSTTALQSRFVSVEGNRLLAGKAGPWAKAWQRAERKNFLDGLKRLTQMHNSCTCTQWKASLALKTIVAMTTGLKQGMWEPVTRKGLHRSTGNRPGNATTEAGNWPAKICTHFQTPQRIFVLCGCFILC